MIFKTIFSAYNSSNIANKLKFIGATSVLITASIVFSFMLFLSSANEKELTVKESKRVATILSENLVNQMGIEDISTISNILASVEYSDRVIDAFVVNNYLKIVSFSQKNGSSIDKDKIFQLIKKNQNFWNEEYFYRVEPIIKDEITLGKLILVSHLGELYSYSLRNIVFFLVVIFFSLLITYQLMKVLQESILKPIITLNNITKKIRNSKNLKYIVPNFNSDEIGDLAKSFKQMIADLDAQKEKLSYQAYYDSLTSLPNRYYFNDRLNESIYKANRHDENFALFFIDLDHFKELNTTYGHEQGDIALETIAKRLSSLLRVDDTLARYGGDEFMIIMNKLTSHQYATVLVNKILNILEEPIKIENEEIVISASIGISICPKDSNNKKELIKNVDTAMYKSKNAGRNTYTFYEE